MGLLEAITKRNWMDQYSDWKQQTGNFLSYSNVCTVEQGMQAENYHLIFDNWKNNNF